MVALPTFETNHYSNDLTVAEARELYFRRSGFTAATYTEKWIKLPFWRFHFYLYNFSARKKAVPLHDIDHVLTEYDTSWKGEWQISAYEIGTGCGRYWAGWYINLQGILVGGLFYPRLSLRAFSRGRRSKGVFHFQSHNELNDKSVGALRKDLTTDAANIQVTASDVWQFYSWVLLSLIVNLMPIAVFMLLLITARKLW